MDECTTKNRRRKSSLLNSVPPESIVASRLENPLLCPPLKPAAAPPVRHVGPSQGKLVLESAHRHRPGGRGRLSAGLRPMPRARNGQLRRGGKPARDLQDLGRTLQARLDVSTQHTPEHDVEPGTETQTSRISNEGTTSTSPAIEQRAAAPACSCRLSPSHRTRMQVGQ